MRTSDEFETAVFSAVKQKKIKKKKTRNAVITTCICMAVCLTVGIGAYPKIRGYLIGPGDTVIENEAYPPSKPIYKDDVSDMGEEITDTLQDDVKPGTDSSQNKSEASGSADNGAIKEDTVTDDGAIKEGAVSDDSGNQNKNEIPDYEAGCIEDVETGSTQGGNNSGSSTEGGVHPFLSSTQPTFAMQAYRFVYKTEPTEQFVSFEVYSLGEGLTRFVFHTEDGTQQDTTLEKADEIITQIRVMLDTADK